LPSVISTISIDQISINEPIKGNDPFTIDPAQASFIYDVDKKVTMTVPR
jgi:hypothetical protein